MITAIIRKISTIVKLTKIVQEASDTYTFMFTAPDNIKWSSGSHAHVLSSDLKNGKKMKKELVRELSIMTHPDEKQIGFTTRIRKNPSEFKKIMLNLKVGDEVRVFKIGNHLKKHNEEHPIVLISMGVGIATFRPLIIDYLAHESQLSHITNINIDRSGDFVFKEELDKLSGIRLKNVFVKTRDELYEEINQCIRNIDNVYYIVGSGDFNKSIGDYLTKNNVPKKAILFDKH